MGHLAPGRDVAGLNGAYHIERALSSSGHFAATKDGEAVLLKEVHVGDADAWTRIDALARDARVVRHLSHPRIPAFLELFVYDGERARAPEALSRAAPSSGPEGAGLPSLVLARRFVEGCSLAEAIREGRRFVAADIERMLRGLLEARRYLDDLLPAVVHGEISPAKVILGPDGQPFLIDFGTAAEPQEDPMIAAGAEVSQAPPAPQSSPWTASADLYAIAMTVLAAASHLTPAQMPRSEREATIDVARVAPLLSYRVEQALKLCLRTEPARRPQKAAEVLARLDERWPKARRAAESVAARLRSGRARRPLAVALVALTGVASGAAYFASAHDPAPVIETPELLREADFIETPPPAGQPGSTAEPTSSAAPGADEPAAPEPETPSAEPEPAKDETTTLEWTGVIQRATGGHSAGETCVLKLDVVPGADVSVCAVQLACGDEIMIAGEIAVDCHVSEIAAGDNYTYQAGFWIDGADASGLDAAMFGPSGRFYGSRTDSSGKKTESWRIKLAEKSLPRSGEALFESRRFAREKTFHGTAISANGRRVAKGEACTYTVGPNTETDFVHDSSNGCAAKVECGGRVLYDGAGECVTTYRGDPHYSDTSPSAIDGDPRLNFSGNQLTVADIEPTGAWKVVVYLDEDPAPNSQEE